MYLKGTFKRTDIFDGELDDVKLVSEIDRTDLAKAKDDDEYQVINLETFKYFNPKKNTWENLPR